MEIFSGVFKDRGFLAYPDPLPCFPVGMRDELYEAEEIAMDLPTLIPKGEVRSKLDKLLPANIDYMWGKPIFDRAMMIYSYLASAYVFADLDDVAKKVPNGVAVPLVSLSRSLRVDRPPILSYASYCLHNWKRKDPNKSIELGNIELLQNFFGGEDEDWFILVHVAIEATAAVALRGCWNLCLSITGAKQQNIMEDSLQDIRIGLERINSVLARMTEHCCPDVYYKKVRPYIFSFPDGVVYEGTTIKSNGYRGETGAQSSIVPAILIALRIKHEDNILTEHLRAMRQYMPFNHRQFLNCMQDIVNMHEVSLRSLVVRFGYLKEMYNQCVEQLVGFRKLHLQYAVDYIQKKSDNPSGTGGTPYMKFLGDLIKETEGHMIN